ncbi:MAG TPA: glycosyltransferase [Thermomicrobiales bacterium]|nr:glycosyltransferase [Thermomicrobiales bacterium]
MSAPAEQAATEAMDSQSVAYIVLRFPTLSETFIVREIHALRSRGWQVAIYPLWRDTPEHVHPDVPELEPSVRWTHPLSFAALRATLGMLARRPSRYLSALGLVLSELPRRPKRAVISLGLFPVIVWMAGDLERRGIRHVHAHFASYPTLAAHIIQRLTGISYSFTAHAFDLYVDPSHLANKVSGATFIVTISEYNRERLRPLAGGVTPVHVIHCGVRVPATLPERWRLGREVVCVARLEEKKGQTYLIDACRLLHERGASLHCTIVGGGPEMNRLRAQIAAAGLEDVVTLAGPQTSERVQQYLAGASVFALPSVVTRSGNAEGIPVALMEAMAAGVPVISTSTTGIPELVIDGETGLLVPPRDAVALADAIERLLDDSALGDELRLAAFQKVRDEFELDANAREIERHLAGAIQDQLPLHGWSPACDDWHTERTANH